MCLKHRWRLQSQARTSAVDLVAMDNALPRERTARVETAEDTVAQARQGTPHSTIVSSVIGNGGRGAARRSSIPWAHCCTT